MVHTDGRRRGRSRPRILYWFRTPPGVRVGRAALDESAIRLIEEFNPDVEFDWTRILKGQETPAEPKAAPPDRRGRSRPREYPRPAGSGAAPARVDQADRAPAPPSSSSSSSSSRLSPAASRLGSEGDQTVAVSSEAAAAPEATGSAPREPVPADAIDRAGTLTAAEGRDDGDAPPPLDDAAIDELLSDSSPARTMSAAAASDIATPAQARLGSEGLSRLRARYAEVLARISETITDPMRRDELKSQAERLNPDTWVTDAEVTEGLEQYETVFESLRTVVGRRRKRRRRPRSPGGPASPAGGAPSISSPDSAGGEEDDGEDTGGEL